MSWADTPPELYDRLESFGQEMLALAGFRYFERDWAFQPASTTHDPAEELIAWP